jgi:hypothetical protein
MIKNIILISMTGIFLTLFDSSLALSESQTKTISIWRCGYNIIQIGDSKSSVLSKCGPPTTKGKKPLYTRHPRTINIDASTTEVWNYNCGSNQFNTSLTFHGDKLLLMYLGKYGSGESYCNGAKGNPNNKKSLNK